MQASHFLHCFHEKQIFFFPSKHDIMLQIQLEMRTNQHKVKGLLSAEYSNVLCCELANRGKRNNTGQFAHITARLFPWRYDTGDQCLVEWLQGRAQNPQITCSGATTQRWDSPTIWLPARQVCCRSGLFWQSHQALNKSTGLREGRGYKAPGKAWEFPQYLYRISSDCLQSRFHHFR